MTLVAPSVSSSRSGVWQADPGFGVYVHVPFCKHRCHYCDFNTYEGQDHLHRAYTDALIGDIHRSAGNDRLATSVFFGGGTPTLLPAGGLGDILGAIRDRVGIAADAEITVEANPETVDERYLSELLEHGVNRISVGVQSLVPKVLVGLGRTHPPEVALDAIRAARRAGFEDINADLIYGSPWESDDDWQVSLDGIVDVGVDHVSAYALTIEEGTPLDTLIRTGRQPDVDPDVQASRHEMASDRLRTAGFARYEVSNWARPGRASRHNVLYWSGGDYFGFGAGAHGHLNGRRAWTVRLPRDFIAAVDSGTSTEDGSESLGADARAGEALMLGLRLQSGVDLVQFARRFGERSLQERREVLRECESRGLVEQSDGCVRLSERGTLLANDVLCRLL